MTLSQRAATCRIRAALYLSFLAQHSPELPVHLLRWCNICDCATVQLLHIHMYSRLLHMHMCMYICICVCTCSVRLYSKLLLTAYPEAQSLLAPTQRPVLESERQDADKSARILKGCVGTTNTQWWAAIDHAGIVCVCVYQVLWCVCVPGMANSAPLTTPNLTIVTRYAPLTTPHNTHESVSTQLHSM